MRITESVHTVLGHCGATGARRGRTWGERGWLGTGAAAILVTAALPLVSSHALAHEPIALCVQLDETTVRCRGGYAHGEDAPGQPMEVIGHDGASLVQSKLGSDSTLTFRKPTQPFYVVFNSAPGHQVVIEQEEIGPVPSGKRRAAWMTAPWAADLIP